MDKLPVRYIREVDGQLVWATPKLIKRENPGMNFPRITDDIMAQFGCSPVYQPDRPGTLAAVQPDPVYEADGVTLAEAQPDPVYDIPPLTPTQKLVWDDLPTWDEAEQKYIQGWTAVDKTQEELLAEIPWKDATEARKAVVEWIDGLTAQIETLYPSAVQKRWEIEEAAARAVKAGTADTRQLALVTDEGATKGRTPEEHADAIIANADRFRKIADETNKLFLATDAQIQAAASPLEYPAIFEWAQQQAAPLAAAYGLSVEG